MNTEYINMVDLLRIWEDTGLSNVANYKYCIAGGYCRDVRLGITPKDADILVCGMTNEKDAFEKAVELSEYISMNGLGSSVVYHAYGQTDHSVGVTDDFSSRHYCCINIQLNNSIPIDILFETSESLREAISHFDCNLNQYAWTWAIPRFTPTYFGSHPKNELHFLKDVRGKRIDKMTAFYEEHIKTCY